MCVQGSVSSLLPLNYEVPALLLVMGVGDHHLVSLQIRQRWLRQTNSTHLLQLQHQHSSHHPRTLTKSNHPLTNSSRPPLEQLGVLPLLPRGGMSLRRVWNNMAVENKELVELKVPWLTPLYLLQ